MTEFSVPAKFTIADDANCTDVIFDIATQTPNKTIFSEKVDGQWKPVSAAAAAATVTALAKGFIAQGIEPGDRVALLSRTRLEWTLIDFAIWTAGAIPVPIYDSSSGPQIDWILQDSQAVAIVVEDDGHRAIVDAIGSDRAGSDSERAKSPLSNVKTVYQIDNGDDGIVAVLTAAGADVPDSDVAARRAGVKASDPATLIYTSGTTGRPKGCMLTHSNMLSEIDAVLEGNLRLLLGPGKRLLMFLPLAHVLARAITIVALKAGVEVGFFSDTRTLLPEFAAFKPSLILSVPRVFEKVYNTARQGAHDGGKGKIFDAAADTAVAYSEALDAGGAGLVLKLKHTLFDKLVYSKLRTALGSQCELAISGGAPLGARLGHFFRGAGIPVYEGYGLTESTAAFSVNTPGEHKIGTVGKPLAGNAVRIADDGEVLLSGGVVFDGYWQNPEATAAALEGGWFHTGDLGAVDSQGFLSITGRKKELIVTAGGKNVSPAGLEDVIRASALVSQAMVVGDQQPFIAALVTIDPEAFPGWKERNGKSASATIEELADDADLRAEVQAAIDEANKTVSHAEAIKKFTVLPNDFTEETGEMTPTLKVKRNVVSEKYADAIAGLYAK